MAHRATGPTSGGHKSEYREDAIGGAGHWRRDNSDLACPHSTIEPCCMGIRFSYDAPWSSGSSEIKCLLEECAPNSLSHAPGIHPNVLERPRVASILEGAHSDETTNVLSDQDAVLDEIARLDR